jgi:hypothetical protein
MYAISSVHARRNGREDVLQALALVQELVCQAHFVLNDAGELVEARIGLPRFGALKSPADVKSGVTHCCELIPELVPQE